MDYAELLPSLFELKAGNFYIQLASEPDRKRVLKMVREYKKSHQRVFVGVINVLERGVETSEDVRDRVLEAAEYIPLDQLGTTDDCGFAPFSDDTSRSRDTAFRRFVPASQAPSWPRECSASTSAGTLRVIIKDSQRRGTRLD